MAKQKTAPAPPAPTQLPHKTLILDNGAHTLKAGFSSPDADIAQDCHVISNCVARSHRDKRTYIGPELTTECDDFGELAFRRPVEKGYIVNWESEKAIWERTLFDKKEWKGRNGLQVEEAGEVSLLLTEQPGATTALQRNADEMVFEEFGFGGYARMLGLSVCTSCEGEDRRY